MNILSIMTMVTNFQVLKKLKKKIKDEGIRYKIIFLDTFIGSYEARKNNKDKFLDIKRRVSSDLYEAEYIAKERYKTLKLLRKETPTKVLEKLKKEASDLHNDNIPKSGLYSYFEYFKSNEDLISQAGKRLETRILTNGEKMEEEIEDKKMDNHLIKKIFYNESDTMSGALFYELQFIDKKNHQWVNF